MRKEIYLPAAHKDERIIIDDCVILQTTTGLVKEKNEDSLGYSAKGKSKRVCVADGHWGEEASRIAVQYWIHTVHKFPTNHESAVANTQTLEEMLFAKFGQASMDEDKDFTPEVSFTCIEVVGNTASIVSYGDTRLLIANNGKLKYKQVTQETWLGAFSRLGLRNRTSAQHATSFASLELIDNDFIFLFTDGVDQCVYGKDTIPLEAIAKLSKHDNLNELFNSLFQKIFEHGAEDNASFVALKHSLI